MIKTPRLEEVCQELGQIEPDFDKISRRFKQNSRFKPDKAMNIHDYARHFSVLHLYLALEQIAEGREDVELDVLPDGTSCGKISYFYVDSLLHRKRRDGKVVPPSSRVVGVGGVPAYFYRSFGKVKTHKFTGKGGRNNGGIVTGPMNAMRQEVYLPRLNPIRDHFSSDIGYVVFTTKDNYENEILRSGSIFRNFTSRGGLLVPFPMAREEFREGIREFIHYEAGDLKLV